VQRRVLTIGIAAIAATGAVLVTVPSWASHGGKEAPHKHAHARAEKIMATLDDPGQLRDYGFGVGRLIKAEVCVHGDCVKQRFAKTPECPPVPAVCIGTSVFAKRLAPEVTLSVEIAST
jgi:hypothetical protein